ncbi:MAG: hypothetical protein BGO31_02405 [Bacteroidetes bacterium 43-16]|nr:MAG: hypothetical protein BGO31_02405 [Bacteroidetes bacterium 43-16]
MIPYLLLFILAFIVYWQKDQSNKPLYYFFMACCILFAGSRDMIGGFDVYIYAEVFESYSIPRLLTFPFFEKGYLLYNALVRQLVSDRYYFFFITSFITIWAHFGAIKKLSPLLFFALFIYFSKFFLMSFVYVRQFMAMGIVWWALVLLINKKRVIPILMLVVAYFFHKSSILFFPMIFLLNVKFTRNQMILLIFGVFAIFLSPIGNFLLTFLAENSDNEKLAYYTEKANAINFLYVIEGLLLSYVAYIYKNAFYQNPKTTVIFNGFLIYIVITIVAITNATYARFSWYFFIFIIIGLPYVYLYINNLRERKTFRFLVFLYFAILLVRMLFVWDNGDLMPYKAFYMDTERKGQFDFMEYRR